MSEAEQPAPKRHKSFNRKGCEIFVADPDREEADLFVHAEELRGLSVQQVACSDHGCYVLTANKKVNLWPNSAVNDDPIGKRAISTATKSLIDERIVQIAAGGHGQFVAVGLSGAVYSWGDGECGTLGHNDETNVALPKKIEALKDTHIVQVSCGDFTTVFLSSSGEVYTCGSHEEGLTGHGIPEGKQLVPRLVEGLKGMHVTQVSAYSWHVAAVTDQCDLYTWGWGHRGCLGHSNEDTQREPKLVKALQGKTIQVSCGDSHTAVIAKDGLYTFGCGSTGQLGHGDNRNLSEPTAVPMFGNNVQQVSCGENYTACVSGGSLFLWGAGQLSPKTVEELKDYHVSHVLFQACPSIPIAFVSLESMGPSDAIPVIPTFASMINDEDASDVSFLVENEQIFALKAILVKRCPFFHAMFSSGLSESTNLHNITISNVRKEVFLLVLQFLYTDSVHVEPEDVIDLYVAADMYQLPRLQSTCVASLEKDLTVANAASLLEKAAACGYEQPKSVCLQFVVLHISEVSKTKGFKQIQNPALLHDVLANISS